MHFRQSLELLIWVLNFRTLKRNHPIIYSTLTTHHRMTYDAGLNTISTNQAPPKAILEQVIDKSPNAQLDLLQFSTVFEAAPLVGCSGKCIERLCIPSTTPSFSPHYGCITSTNLLMGETES